MRRLFCALLVGIYVLLLGPFAELQKNRPVEVKLGYLPHSQILKIASGEHRPTTAALIVMRVLFYYGAVIQKFQENVFIRPEFYNLFKTVQSIVDLDPYNMDPYYFAQAVFTWDIGRIQEVNFLLEQGMRKRTWDPSLPFYLGFNHAYFIKNYAQAAVYMKKAAEISGNPLYTQLAARYFYESEQTSFGLAYLESMIETTNNKAVRRNYELRRDALLATTIIEKAIERYREQLGKVPEKLVLLVESGFLAKIPEDPYGGEFYMDEQGRVRTTSKFSTPREEDYN